MYQTVLPVIFVFFRPGKDGAEYLGRVPSPAGPAGPVSGVVRAGVVPSAGPAGKAVPPAGVMSISTSTGGRYSTANSSLSSPEQVGCDIVYIYIYFYLDYHKSKETTIYSVEV